MPNNERVVGALIVIARFVRATRSMLVRRKVPRMSRGMTLTGGL